MPISSVAEINPKRQQKHLSLKDNEEVTFLPMSAIDENKGCIKVAETKKFMDVSNGYTFFMENDVLFAKITPCMQNGKSAIAQNLNRGIGFGTTEFHVFRPNENVLLNKWLLIIFRTKFFRDEAQKSFSGTAGHQRVTTDFFTEKVIPVPPIEEQAHIVAYLDNLQAKVNTIKKHQAETQQQINALMPAILDKAFKGKL